jgi:hypothetical protein
MKMPISASSSCLRGQRRVARVSSGARRGDGDAQVLAHLREQAHDDEFRGADAEGAGRQGEEGDGHGKL